MVVSLPPTAAAAASQQQSNNDDEGLGSMSPDPLSTVTVAAMITQDNSNEIIELGRQLERERQARHHLEKQLRTIQSQPVYTTAAAIATTTDRFRVDDQQQQQQHLIAYQPHEVKE